MSKEMERQLRISPADLYEFWCGLCGESIVLEFDDYLAACEETGICTKCGGILELMNCDCSKKQ